MVVTSCLKTGSGQLRKVATLLFALCGGALCAADEMPSRSGPAVGPGARIFVTKIYPNEFAPENFRQLADAGFTMVVKETDILGVANNAQALEYMPKYFRA